MLMLGLLSAMGPFALDMYLPALPSIGQSLEASMGGVQASLMAFFISLGIGQIICGPLSDMFGHKLPLYFGLVLFALGSVGCAMTPDIHTLIVLRFVQGLGASAGMVIPRAVVRDLHTGLLSARFGLDKLVKVAVTGFAAVMVLLLAMNLVDVDRLDVMLALLFLGYGFLGLVLPTTAVLALDANGAIAGTASALIGTLQFVTGAVVMAIVGLFADGSARPMLAGIAGCAVVALALSWATLDNALTGTGDSHPKCLP